MTDNSIPGPMSMVKVDGTKIKHLRESQGLTQLYLATAVQVTTDTISRWENKRYPSIKKENGIKLAEALNVQLEDLLEDEAAILSPATEPARIEPGRFPEGVGRSSSWKMWSLLLFTIVGLVFLSTFVWRLFKPSPPLIVTAERNAPEHCLAGQPFPVLIRITGFPADKSTAAIIRENLPVNATVLKISPDIAGGGMKREMIKWLKKISDSGAFAYMISVSGKPGDKIEYYGTAAISGDSSTPTPISGSSSTTIGLFHWADSDKDNIISDSEVLAVHDRYGEIEGMDVDIDTIEEIWLGSGYTVNETTGALEILE